MTKNSYYKKLINIKNKNKIMKYVLKKSHTHTHTHIYIYIYINLNITNMRKKWNLWQFCF